MLRLKAHAFTASAPTRELVEQAWRDRRLGKLELGWRRGGLTEARAAYAHEPSAPLLLVEAETAAPDELLARVEDLAEVCEPGTNLILLGTANDVETYRALIRQGVADYLVLPVAPARLVESILDLYADPTKAPAGQVLAFVGARGGCGSSTLAHNAAVALARSTEADVLVVDLDLPFGCADLTFNIETPLGIRNVLADPERIDEVFLQRFAVKYGERVQLLAAAPGLDAAAVDPRALETAIEALRRHVRYVVLDLPHLWSEWLRQTLHQSDAVVVTTTPDLAGVRNARHLLDVLAAGRPPEDAPTLVLNRVGALRKGEVTARDVAHTVGTAPHIVIPEDADAFGLAASAGKMVEEVRPRAKAAQAIRQLAARLGAPPKGQPVKGGAAKGSATLPAWLARLLPHRGT